MQKKILFNTLCNVVTYVILDQPGGTFGLWIAHNPLLTVKRLPSLCRAPCSVCLAGVEALMSAKDCPAAGFGNDGLTMTTYN